MAQPNSESGTKEDLALYRLETAKQDLASAKVLFGANQQRGYLN